jgi:uncharacterized protein with NRDE domain
MCTVVVRWTQGRPLLVLGLRDELTGRDFDDPGEWWPEQPGVIGGRDRTAGGSWCVTDVAIGTTALVLNRPQRRQAAPGAPSRGVLPLLAVKHGEDWPAHLDRSGMASFALVLAAPDALTLWVFDGEELTATELAEGTHMVTSGGAEDGKADRYLGAFTAAGSAAEWRALVTGQLPQDDPAALVVRHQKDDLVFATVFGQLISSAPGTLVLEHSRTPWVEGTWTEGRWPAP